MHVEMHIRHPGYYEEQKLNMDITKTGHYFSHDSLMICVMLLRPGLRRKGEFRLRVLCEGTGLLI